MIESGKQEQASAPLKLSLPACFPSVCEVVFSGRVPIVLSGILIGQHTFSQLAGFGGCTFALYSLFSGQAGPIGRQIVQTQAPNWVGVGQKENGEEAVLCLGRFSCAVVRLGSAGVGWVAPRGAGQSCVG